jgi:hypothetical protein
MGHFKDSKWSLCTKSRLFEGPETYLALNTGEIHQLRFKFLSCTVRYRYSLCYEIEGFSFIQGNLCVWDVEGGSVRHFISSQRKFNICALAWNPHRDEVGNFYSAVVGEDIFSIADLIG